MSIFIQSCKMVKSKKIKWFKYWDNVDDIECKLLRFRKYVLVFYLPVLFDFRYFYWTDY